MGVPQRRPRSGPQWMWPSIRGGTCTSPIRGITASGRSTPLASSPPWPDRASPASGETGVQPRRQNFSRLRAWPSMLRETSISPTVRTIASGRSIPLGLLLAMPERGHLDFREMGVLPQRPSSPRPRISPWIPGETSISPIPATTESAR